MMNGKHSKFKGGDNLRLKDFLKTVKGNDFELYNDFEELLFTTMGYCYKPESLLPYAKHEVDLVECCIKNCKPFLRIYIIEKGDIIMLNIGKKSSVKDELCEYVKVNKDEIVEHDIYIEKVIVGKTEENDCFAAVAGMDLTNNNNKVWFYAPTYDDACLCQATPEEIKSICNNNYLYFMEKNEGKNGRTYYTGYITEGR